MLIFLSLMLFTTNCLYGDELNSDLININKKNGKGYKIAGICFSSVGGACIVTSIPLIGIASYKTKRNKLIGPSVQGIIGGYLSTGGLLLGGVSIPLFIKYKKLNKETNVSFNFSSNEISMLYEF
jgi:hypothetical protein